MLAVRASLHRRPPGCQPDDPRLTWHLTPSDSDENQRSGGYGTDELPKHVCTRNLGNFASV